MAQIKWTPQSLDDIEAIANFIARDSTYYARMFTTKVFEAVDRLDLFSESAGILRGQVSTFNISQYRWYFRHFPSGFLPLSTAFSNDSQGLAAVKC